MAFKKISLRSNTGIDRRDYWPLSTEEDKN